jgi:excisionase family DNA binding protein
MALDPKLPPFLSAEEAFAILGVDRKTGYRAIKSGTFPVRVVRVGRLIRVPTAALARALEGADDERVQNLTVSS